MGACGRWPCSRKLDALSLGRALASRISGREPGTFHGEGGGHFSRQLCARVPPDASLCVFAAARKGAAIQRNGNAERNFDSIRKRNAPETCIPPISHDSSFAFDFLMSYGARCATTLYRAGNRILN
ncbi:hypothetical protein MTO96_022247 [Rhipicephalus appendiculatus]